MRERKIVGQFSKEIFESKAKLYYGVYIALSRQQFLDLVKFIGPHFKLSHVAALTPIRIISDGQLFDTLRRVLNLCSFEC